MEKKNKSERICPSCGRIIADPNNKIGLCPICQKSGLKVTFGVAVIGIIVKKFGIKIVKGAIISVKNVLKL